MAEQYQKTLELLITSKIDGLTTQLNAAEKKLEHLEDKAAKSSKGISSGFKSALPDISKFSAGLAVGALALNELGKAFDAMQAKETALADLSAITGITGNALDDLGDKAVSLSNAFGTSTVENIESFKGVVSRLGPAFANSADAMQKMGENVNILSKASGLDATTSMNALTTAMLQFGVNLDNPIKASAVASEMMNIMAAGAKEGAAEIPQLADALTQVGSTASSLNITFAETTAALEVLATKGKYGSEAGIALRNSLIALAKPSKDAEDALKNVGYSSVQFNKTLTTKGISAAFVELRDKINTLPTVYEKATLKTTLFGKENLAAADALLSGAESVAVFNSKIQGTNTALEQANINMNTTTERWNRFTNKITNALASGMEDSKKSLLDWGDALGNLFSGDFKKVIQYQYGLTEAVKPTTAELLAQKEAMKQASETSIQYSGNLLAGVQNLVAANEALVEASKPKVIEKENENTRQWIKARIATLEKENETLDLNSKKLKANEAEITSLNLKLGKKPQGAKAKKQNPFELLGIEVSNMEDGKEKLKANLDYQLKVIDAADESLEIKSARKVSAQKAYNKAIEELENKERTNAIEHNSKMSALNAEYILDGEDKELKLVAIERARIEQLYKLGLLELSQYTEQLEALKIKRKQIDLAHIQNNIVSNVPSLSDMLDKDLKKSEESFARFTDASIMLGNAMGNAFVGGSTGMKAALKSSLLVLLDYAEKQLLVASALATLQTIFGNFGAYAALAGGIVLLEIAKSGVNSFDVGAWNIPQKQAAIVHPGELITPPAMSDEIRSGRAALIGNPNRNTSGYKRQGNPRKTVVVRQSVSNFGAGIDGYEYETTRKFA